MRRTVIPLAAAAEQLNLPEATLRWYRHVGDRGPQSFLVGRRVMYYQDDLDSWVAAQYAQAVRATPLESRPSRPVTPNDAA